MLRRPTIFRWTRIGAVLGFIVILFDFVFEWRGPQFEPWTAEGTAANIGLIIGSVLGGAILGLIAGAISDRWARSPEKIF